MDIATITATQSYDLVDTFALRDGDLVLSHGMLLRLTEGRDTCHGAKAFDGVIENPTDVPDYVREFIGDSDTWRVQGNHLAHWMRVDEAALAEDELADAAEAARVERSYLGAL